MLVADLAQALQVADRRYQYAGGADIGSTITAAMFEASCSSISEQFVGQLDAAGLGHPAGERHARLQGVRQVVDVHQLAEHLAVAADPAEAGAGDVDPW